MCTEMCVCEMKLLNRTLEWIYNLDVLHHRRVVSLNILSVFAVSFDGLMHAARFLKNYQKNKITFKNYADV